MGSLLIGHSADVGRFVAERSPIERPDFGKFVGIGMLRSDGVLGAGVVFSDWQPPCRRIELSGAVDDPRAISTGAIVSIGDYVFRQLNVYRVWSKTSKDNRRALKLLEQLGFIREGIMASFYGPDQHAIVLRVTEPEWRRKWGRGPLEGSGIMGGGSAPTPPNPQQVSQQQTQSNVQTGVANATLGNTNQVTPYGSLTYNETGGRDVGGNWVPSYTATQTLSPEQQQIYNKTTGLQNQALDLGPQALTNVGTSLNTPLPDETTLRNQAYDALTGRANQALDLQQKAQGATLANQGIAAGSNAYDNAMRPLMQERTDIANQGVINAGNVAGQNLQQAQAIHNQPLQDYSALLGFGGGVQQPTYAPASAGQVAPTDVSSNAYNSYNGQLQQYQTQQGQQNALMGGLFGLGGSALGIAGLYGGKKLFG